ncbi:hypothetical protein [Actinophytocola sp.]|uniref:hypothetical protein n=1 Tax=Actinophytocola sp. TaxID=1872138 RepID=UPI002ED629C0
MPSRLLCPAGTHHLPFGRDRYEDTVARSRLLSSRSSADSFDGTYGSSVVVMAVPRRALAHTRIASSRTTITSAKTAADDVRTSPDAYRQVRSRWRRRERRRRLVVALLATGVIVAANGIALWTLNDATPDQHIIFTEPVAP